MPIIQKEMNFPNWIGTSLTLKIWNGAKVLSLSLFWCVLKLLWDTMLGAKRSGGLRLSVTDTVSQPVRRGPVVVCHVTAKQNRKVSERFVKLKRPLERTLPSLPWNRISIAPSRRLGARTRETKLNFNLEVVPLKRPVSLQWRRRFSTWLFLIKPGTDCTDCNERICWKDRRNY